jgi:hypothetical protein
MWVTIHCPNCITKNFTSATNVLVVNHVSLKDHQFLWSFDSILSSVLVTGFELVNRFINTLCNQLLLTSNTALSLITQFRVHRYTRTRIPNLHLSYPGNVSKSVSLWLNLLVTHQVFTEWLPILHQLLVSRGYLLPTTEVLCCTPCTLLYSYTCYPRNSTFLYRRGTDRASLKAHALHCCVTSPRTRERAKRALHSNGRFADYRKHCSCIVGRMFVAGVT